MSSKVVILAELGFAIIEALQIQAEGDDISDETWAKIRSKMDEADAYFDAAVAARRGG